jgi:hypothetical protein
MCVGFEICQDCIGREDANEKFTGKCLNYSHFT